MTLRQISRVSAAELESAENVAKAAAFSNLSAQDQYTGYVKSAINAADAISDAKQRLQIFSSIMDGFLQASGWNVAGSRYAILSDQIQLEATSGSLDDMLAAFVQSEHTSLTYIAVSTRLL